MKRWLAFGLVLTLVLCQCAFGIAEEETLTVGTLTQPSGSFFVEAWGGNTSDIDVRSLIQGYCITEYGKDGMRKVNSYAVKDFVITQKNSKQVHTVTLQKGLTYNDGTPITAYDYVFYLLLLCSDEAKSTGNNSVESEEVLGYDLYHAPRGNILEKAQSAETEAVRQGSTEEDASSLDLPGWKTEVFSGVRILDDYSFSVTVQMNNEYYYKELLYYALPVPISVLAPGCEVADDGKGAYIRITEEAKKERIKTARGEGNDTKPEWYGIFCKEMLAKTLMDPETGYMSHPTVTSGPYNLISYDHETGTAEFTANKRFLGNYQGQKPTIQNIKLITLKNEECVDALLSGKVDLINKITDGEVIDQLLTVNEDNNLKGKKKISTESYDKTGFGMIAFAAEKEVTDSQAVRQAIAYALDVEELCEQFTNGHSSQVFGYYGNGQWETQYANFSENYLFGSLKKYSLNVNTALRLLQQDGWKFNESGKRFSTRNDTLRYKQLEDGTMIPLVLNLGVTENNRLAAIVEELLRPNCEKLGIELNIHKMSFEDLLNDVNRVGERTCNMYLLSTNFSFEFDPYYTYRTDESSQILFNTSGIEDQQLSELTLAMHQTAYEDWETYFLHWVDFQVRWNEILPAIPLYSGMYFDAYTVRLKGYYPGENYSWATAIMSAKLQDK